jgi:hypothetical protein
MPGIAAAWVRCRQDYSQHVGPLAGIQNIKEINHPLRESGHPDVSGWTLVYDGARPDAVVA